MAVFICSCILAWSSWLSSFWRSANLPCSACAFWATAALACSAACEAWSAADFGLVDLVLHRDEAAGEGLGRRGVLARLGRVAVLGGLVGHDQRLAGVGGERLVVAHLPVEAELGLLLVGDDVGRLVLEAAVLLLGLADGLLELHLGIGALGEAGVGLGGEVLEAPLDRGEQAHGTQPTAILPQQASTPDGRTGAVNESGGQADPVPGGDGAAIYAGQMPDGSGQTEEAGLVRSSGIVAVGTDGQPRVGSHADDRDGRRTGHGGRGRGLQPGQQHAQHDLRPAPRGGPVGHPRPGPGGQSRAGRRRGHRCGPHGGDGLPGRDHGRRHPDGTAASCTSTG